MLKIFRMDKCWEKVQRLVVMELLIPVVQKLYDSVPIEERSPFHGKCAEADYLSQIANQTG